MNIKKLLATMHEKECCENELRILYQNYHTTSKSDLTKKKEIIRLLRSKIKQNQFSCSHILGLNLNETTYCAFCNLILPSKSKEVIKVADYPEMVSIEHELMNILLLEPINLTPQKLIKAVKNAQKGAKLER